MESGEVKEVWEAVQRFAIGAGTILRKGLDEQFGVSYKSNPYDLVTDLDKRVEDYLVEQIRRFFPTAGILGEEGGTYREGMLQWIIDPLDGTVNFAHRLPIFSVSIAVVGPGQQIIAGAVYQPVLEELFSAAVGYGAFVGDVSLQVSSTETLEQSLLVTGFPYNVADNPRYCIDQFVAFLRRGIPVRRLGSAALDLAYVAAGRFDGFWESMLNPWDVAAGILLVQQAGGRVTTDEGAVHPVIESSSILASNGHIHSQMLTVIQSVLVQAAGK